jgi:muconolactone delta-isomerase
VICRRNWSRAHRRVSQLRGTGRTTVLGLYRAGSKAEHKGLLGALPVNKSMRTSITPLVWHPKAR